MYRRKAVGGKKKRAARGERVTVWFPPIVLDILDQAVNREGCSRSWLVTAAVCAYLGISEGLVAEARGYEIPKRFEDRVGEWTLAKGKDVVGDLLTAGFEKPIEYTCKGCGEQVVLDSETPKEVVKALAGLCVRCAYRGSGDQKEGRHGK